MSRKCWAHECVTRASNTLQSSQQHQPCEIAWWFLFSYSEGTRRSLLSCYVTNELYIQCTMLTWRTSIRCPHLRSFRDKLISDTWKVGQEPTQAKGGLREHTLQQCWLMIVWNWNRKGHGFLNSRNDHRLHILIQKLNPTQPKYQREINHFFCKVKNHSRWST